MLSSSTRLHASPFSTPPLLYDTIATSPFTNRRICLQRHLPASSSYGHLSRRRHRLPGHHRRPNRQHQPSNRGQSSHHRDLIGHRHRRPISITVANKNGKGRTEKWGSQLRRRHGVLSEGEEEES
ncbi:unnamed protein product [Linum trigynum]|uniref:Uncharacterized protein n=1 Tax=Linum trigynum TaxID=586398 RepID=A0AAV2GN93_9ROSI